MQVQIEDIKINKRIRQDLGDIAALADSFRKYGQMNPIAITKGNVLLAGHRRLEAAKLLGWKSINAIIVELAGPAERLEYEIEENIQRRPFTAQEEADAANTLYKIKNPGFFRKIINAIIRFWKKLFRLEY